MAEMSREEFMKMQHEAENRMIQMQQKAHENNIVHPMPPSPNFVKINRTPSSFSEEPSLQKREIPFSGERKNSQRRRSGGFDILRMLNFQNMSMNSDRSLILAVMMLLSGNVEDELLMLALVYIML